MNTKKRVGISVAAILLLFPLLYLFYKASSAPPLSDAPVAAAAAAPNDLTALENAVNTDPSFDNLINLSMAYINQQMPGKSIDHLKKALTINPQSAIAYNNLGVAYTMLQQYQDGVDACTQALQIDTSFQLAKNNLKWAQGEKNKVLAAIAEQEQVAADKRNVEFYTAYGLNYFRIGEYGKSIEIWNKIFELDEKNVTALNNIGTAFMMKKQVDDAITLFKKALELSPENQLAKNNLAWALDEK